ncbi:MAG: hypothetical protein IJ011_01955 [Clostridia bacterium]|nr:hypothetical protein [Clostridia bacterium]
MKLSRSKLLSILLCVCLVIPAFAVGTFPIANAAEYTEKEITATNTYDQLTPIASATLEEENGVYSIASADDWDALVAKNSDFAGKTIVFTADLDLTGKSSLAALAGKLDGNGKKVTGLTTALITKLSDGAEVINLTVEGAKVTSAASENTAVIAGEAVAATQIKITNVAVKNAEISGLGSTFAGIVGLHSGEGKLTLTNCTVSGTVKGSATETEMHIGGMVGKVNASTGSVELYNCKNSATLSIDVAKNTYFGGMVGDGYAVTADGCVNDGSIIDIEGSYHLRMGGVAGRIRGGKVTLTDCVNNGDITSNVNSSAHTNLTAGMVADLSGSGAVTLTRCENNGDVFGGSKATAAGKSGGLIGYNCAGDTKVTDCINTGNIKGTFAVGGLIADSRRNLYFTNCVNYGDLESYDSGKKDCGDIGGMVGYCNDTSKTTSAINCKNYGDVTGPDASGGIIGMGKGHIIITECYNEGNVKGKLHGVGGILGFGRNDFAITLCVNKGNAYGDYDAETGKVTNSGVGGDRHAGGILGYAYLDGTTASSIKNCLNFGDVADTVNAGGIIGLLTNTQAAFTLESCASFGNVTAGNNAGVIVGRFNSTPSVDVKNCTGDGVLDYQYTSGVNKGVLVGCKKNQTYTNSTATATIDGVKTLSVNGTESAAADNAALITALKIASVDTQVSADKTTAIFVAGVNSLEGLSATGFEVLKINGEGKISNILTKTSEKIFTGLNGYDDNGAAVTTSASAYEVAYMTAMEIYNIPTDETVTYVYRPFVVAEDGETVTYGTTSYVTFEAAVQQ